MRITQAVDFLLCEKSNSTRQSTREFYKEHLKPVLKAFYEQGYENVQDISFIDVSGFIAEWESNNLSNKTINNRVDLIKMIITTASDFERITPDLKKILKIKRRQFASESYQSLTEQQMKDFINYVYNIDENVNRFLKKKCIFLIALQNGIRLKEILSIEIKNVNLGTKTIKLQHTKNGQVRYACFDEYTKSVIEKYIEIYNPKAYLFENNQTHKIMADQTIVESFDIASKQLGFKVTSHMLRASFATLLTKNNMPTEKVRIMMGHTDIRTTQRYIHLVAGDVLNDNREFNPLAIYSKYKRGKDDITSKIAINDIDLSNTYSTKILA